MKTTTFSSLSSKEVVNCKDGQLVGYTADLNIDTDTGDILSLLVKQKDTLFSFSKKPLVEIPFENVEKIGKDIILVNTPSIPESAELCCKKEKKKNLFQSFH